MKRCLLALCALLVGAGEPAAPQWSVAALGELRTTLAAMPGEGLPAPDTAELDAAWRASDPVRVDRAATRLALNSIRDRKPERNQRSLDDSGVGGEAPKLEAVDGRMLGFEGVKLVHDELVGIRAAWVRFGVDGHPMPLRCACGVSGRTTGIEVSARSRRRW